SLK
ncbi:ATP cone domain protein, partial [Vibrio parahaemolyticus VP2007-007]